MIHLRQTGSEFATARTGTGDNNQGMCCFDVVIGTVPCITDDHIDIRRIPFGESVSVDLDIASLQFVSEDINRGLIFKASDNHGSDIDPPATQVIDLSHDVNIIGDPEICPHFPTFDVTCIDTQDDICVPLEFLQQLHLDVGGKAGQDPGSVVIEHDLAAELQVKLVIKLLNSLQDLFVLLLEIFFVVETSSLCHRKQSSVVALTYRDSASIVH